MRPRILWLPGGALGVLVLGIAPAMAGAPATLTQALASAYYNNPTLQQQRAVLRQTDEEVPAALSGWRPTVSFQGQIGRVTGVEKYYTTGISQQTGLPVTQQTRVPENGTEKIAQLTVSQPIYTGG
ncbi:MAG: TolC family protein, partial [Rhodospirillales bacterium]|nr:TolC family protein [Rhodospirillales bacterium]